MWTKKTKSTSPRMIIVGFFCFVGLMTSVPVQAEGESCDVSGVGCKDETLSPPAQIINPSPVKKSKRKGKSSPPAHPSIFAPIARPKLTLTKGSDHATVTIIAYTDFQCLPCAKANTVLDQVIEAKRP